MHEGYAKHGEVFTVPVAHKRITFLIGPSVVPHFFNATDDKMSQTEVRAPRCAACHLRAPPPSAARSQPPASPGS
jgi:hypothetical protein